MAEMFLNDGVQWVIAGLMSVIKFIIEYFSNTTSQLFNYGLVTSLLAFFQLFGTALFAASTVFAILETCVSYQSGQNVDVHSLLINIFKGFALTSLFTIMPPLVFQATSDLQVEIINLIIWNSAEELNITTLDGFMEQFVAAFFNDLSAMDILWQLPMILVFLYVIVKIFFGNLKRSGILLCLIFIGSFHIFNLPRGYNDGFLSWVKQIIGLCFTHFAQNILFIVGILLLSNRSLLVLGLGVCLSASEVPRIAQHFGLETSVRGNVSTAIYTASSATALIRSFTR